MIAHLRVEGALPSLANARLHWAKKAKLVKAQRAAVRLKWFGILPAYPWEMRPAPGHLAHVCAAAPAAEAAP